MRGLTHEQAQALDGIRALMAANDGASPSYEEIRLALGLASRSSVHRMLHSLRERGRIDFAYGRSRSLVIVDDFHHLDNRTTGELQALRERIDAILHRRAA